MIEAFGQVGGPVLAVERVPADQVSRYGIVAVEADEGLPPGVCRVTDLVEKPAQKDAPSNLAIIGRYILTPDIFPELEATASDRTGEIQLTNGLRRLLRRRPLFSCEIRGTRHDTGNKQGYLRAVVYFALRRPDLAADFARVPPLAGSRPDRRPRAVGRRANAGPSFAIGRKRAFERIKNGLRVRR